MQIFNLDISIKRVIPLLHVKQRNVGTKILVEITNNGDAYAIPAGASLSVWYCGASGEGNYTKIGENSAFSIQGNTVAVELITQMLNNPGGGKMCLVMNGTDGSQLGLWDIPYFVEAIPGADSEAALAYYSAFQEYTAEAVDAADRASAAAEALEGGLVLKKGEGVDSIAQVITRESGRPEGGDRTAHAQGEGAVAFGDYCWATGENAFTAGKANTASGVRAVAMGGQNEANGDWSTALGKGNFAENLQALATGLSTIAKGVNSATFGTLTKTGTEYDSETNPDSGKNAIAIGNGCIADGINAFAGGVGAKAMANNDFAFGSQTQALGGASVSLGKDTKAMSSYSFAGGLNSEAQKALAFVYGNGLKANAQNQVAFGQFNVLASEVLFMIGNGTSDSVRSNAFAVKNNSIVVGGQELTADTIANIATKSYIEEYIDSLGVAEGRQF